MILVDDIAQGLKEYAGHKIAVMAPADKLSVTPSNVVKWFAADHDAAAYMHSLYSRLHELDKAGAEFILIERPATGDRWDAVQDRLTRAAA